MYLPITRRQRISSDENGMVTAFVVVFVSALFLLVGLVFDGGMILAAKSRTADDADGAARAGAQAIDIASYRAGGEFHLDAYKATQAARSYLAAAGATGNVSVDGDRVTVVARRDQPMQILGIAGFGTVAVEQTGSAHASRGNIEEGQ